MKLIGSNLGGIIAEHMSLDDISEEIDLLLLKMGFGAWRKLPTYYENSPIFRPELAEALRVRFPQLKV